jgi:peptide/nickel transport system substrate-binding protein
VTAKDVKWSLDRAVSVGGFPTFQMSAGSLTKPEQFVVVDDNTVRVDFAKKDRLTIPDLAVIVPCVVNSELVKKNASEKDPWGLEYTKQQTAGSGAYKVTKWTAGTEVVMERRRHLLRAALQGFHRAQGQRQARRGLAAVLKRHPVYRHERHQAAVR